MEISPPEIKILFLANASAVHARRWIGYFRERGYQTRWLSLEDVPPDIEAVKLPAPTPSQVGNLLLAVPRIKREIETFAPHLVNALFIPNYGWIGAMTKFHPLVISAWGSDVLLSPQKSALHRRRISWSIGQADLLFADARIITDRMVELGANEHNVVTVPLGVDPDLLERTSTCAESTDHCRIILTRRFEPLYRNETLVRAAVLLHKRGRRDLSYELIGEGPTKETLAEQIVWMDLTATVQFHSFLPTDRMYDRLADSDIYVSCSESDGTSVSLLEAMALGLYPILSDIPANREWITDRVNGRLFPVGDADRLADVIAEVADSRETWAEVIEKNRELIRARALWPENMAVVEQAMLRLLR